MINGKTIVAIIPARGGSKGIPKKNIKELAGKPLIAWTIEEAKKSKYIDRLILSSEDDEIIEIAKKWHCEVPFKRPMELAQDDTPGFEPVIHAVNALKEKYDYVCLLQPTSPLRKVEHIDGCIEKCFNSNADSCVSITEVDKHPYWMYHLNNIMQLEPFNRGAQLSRRQDAEKLYVLNGAVYFVSTDTFIKEMNFINQKTSGYIMNKKSSIDIDDIFDFKCAEILLNEENN